MHELFFEFVSLASLFIEAMGVIIIIVTVFKGLYQMIFVKKLNFEEIGSDTILNNGLSAALEIILAAEILKTLIARSSAAIIEVGALVIIRIFITIIVHWELIQKERHIEVREREMDVELEEQRD
ncbi:MAG: DUF1622 domain-containing protein [Tissierellia bacterium]|nr:DUF1622 domain-containing protein [Tissierellia bacterium]